MKHRGLAIAILGCCTLGACVPPRAVNTAQVYFPDYAIGEYTQRTDKVTLGAGDDQAVNLRLQENDPWPAHAFDQKIPVDGKRMVEAVERARHLPKQSSQGNMQAVPVGGASGGLNQ